MDSMPDSVADVSADRHRRGGSDWLAGVALLAWVELMPQYRVVCGLFDSHPHHVLHQRPMDSYVDAIDLMMQLNDTAERCATPTLADACAPHQVQQAETHWRQV